MKEVACKILNALFRRAEEQRIPIARLTVGIPYSLEYLRNKHERIEWSVYVDIMANAAKIWSDEEFIDIGAAWVESPFYRYVAVIARLFFSSANLYRFINKPGSAGGHQLLACISPVQHEVGANHFVLEMRLPEGYPHCRPCWLCIQGALTAMPRLINLKRAEVRLEETEWGARFDIVFPKGGAWLSFVKRAVTWPFTLLTAARELRDTLDALQARYDELDGARNTLALQAAQLRTTQSISELIHGDLDLDRTLGAVAHALVDAAHFTAAEVTIAVDFEGEFLERSAKAGQPDSGDGTLVALLSRGREVGRLRLWPTPTLALQEILSSVLPTISMALDNALTHRALVDYRENLEDKVAERTAELRQARDTLAETVNRLQEAQAARDRIFANVNHEIRTPLSLIMLATADIRRRQGAALDARSLAQLDGVEGSARKLLRLVDELLLLAAAQEHKLTLRISPCDLDALLSDTVARWTPAAEAQGLSLSYQSPGRTCLHVDEEKLERVVTNLLSNALKFTPAGGSIQLELSQSPGEVQIAIRDTGIGIDDEFRQRMFGRFEQGRPALHPSARGSGLGLSLAKELVEAHAGTISVDPPRGRGSCFRVTLPANGDRPKTPAFGVPRVVRAGSLGPQDYGLEATAEPVTSVGPAGPAAATLLVAEDDPALADEIARVLGEHYRVFIAPDGLSALRLAQQHLPDLLVSDIGMPGMDGLELTRRFRELPGNRLAPVLLLTAFATLRDRLQGFDAGAVDYIVKPFDPEELRARVRSQLAIRSLALRLHQTEKLAALGTLSAGLAHEMRNPANAIVNAVEPLAELLPPELIAPETPTGQLLGVLRECAGQIALLSRQLLGFKRPGELECAEVAVAELISRALTLTQRTLRSVELRQEGAFRGTVWCAAPLLVQVLANLLENAAYAAGAGGWVRLSVRVTDGRLIVEITDSGPGVPRELRERIFEPFFTTKPPGAGTGLGLTTSREIAQRHGGVLDVRDLPVGSVFHLELPLTAPPREESGRVAFQPGAAS